MAGPKPVLRYLGRYTHRVAISNHRLASFDGEQVTFRWKDCTRKQAAPHDTLVSRVLAALRAACSSTRLRAHSPVWIPCQPAPFREHCSDPPITCFRATIAGSARGRFLRGEVAMSSLRQLDADQPQTYCPRTLLIMRATRYFLKQSITIH